MTNCAGKKSLRNRKNRISRRKKKRKAGNGRVPADRNGVRGVFTFCKTGCRRITEQQTGKTVEVKRTEKPGEMM